MDFKFIGGVLTLIVAVLLLFIVTAGPERADARHNDRAMRAVVKKYTPSREKRVVPTPFCTDSIVFTRRGGHIVRGMGIYASTKHVVVVNNRRFGVTARVLCPR